MNKKSITIFLKKNGEKMKHVFSKTTSILREHNLEFKSQVHEDNTVSIFGDADFSNSNLTELPIEIKFVMGDIDISNNRFTSFDGLPFVSGSIDASNNLLNSFSGLKQNQIMKNLNVSDNLFTVASDCPIVHGLINFKNNYVVHVSDSHIVANFQNNYLIVPSGYLDYVPTGNPGYVNGPTYGDLESQISRFIDKIAKNDTPIMDMHNQIRIHIPKLYKKLMDDVRYKAMVSSLE